MAGDVRRLEVGLPVDGGDRAVERVREELLGLRRGRAGRPAGPPAAPGSAWRSSPANASASSRNGCITVAVALEELPLVPARGDADPGEDEGRLPLRPQVRHRTAYPACMNLLTSVTKLTIRSPGAQPLRPHDPVQADQRHRRAAVAQLGEVGGEGLAPDADRRALLEHRLDDVPGGEVDLEEPDRRRRDAAAGEHPLQPVEEDRPALLLEDAGRERVAEVLAQVVARLLELLPRVHPERGAAVEHQRGAVAADRLDVGLLDLERPGARGVGREHERPGAVAEEPAQEEGLLVDERLVVVLGAQLGGGDARGDDEGGAVVPRGQQPVGEVQRLVGRGAVGVDRELGAARRCRAPPGCAPTRSASGPGAPSRSRSGRSRPARSRRRRARRARPSSPSSRCRRWTRGSPGRSRSGRRRCRAARA